MRLNKVTFSDFFGVFIVIGLYVLYEVYRWKKHEKKMENYEIEYFTPSSYTNAVIETDNPYIKCDNDHPIVYYEMGDEGFVNCGYCNTRYVYKND